MLNPTIITITARGLLGRRRSLLLLPLPMVLLFIAFLARSRGQLEAEDIVTALGLTTIVPLTALIVGTAVLGSEMEDGSVVHILAKPISRLSVIASKWLVAAAVSAVVSAVPIYAATVLIVGEANSLAVGMIVGAIAGSVLYSAVFVAVSAMTKRAVVFGLAYLLLWEGFVTSALTGTRILSIRQYVMRYVDWFTTSPFVDAYLSLSTTIIMSLLVLGVALWQGTDRLRSFKLTGTL